MMKSSQAKILTIVSSIGLRIFHCFIPPVREAESNLILVLIQSKMVIDIKEALL